MMECRDRSGPSGTYRATTLESADSQEDHVYDL